MGRQRPDGIRVAEQRRLNVAGVGTELVHFCRDQSPSSSIVKHGEEETTEDEGGFSILAHTNTHTHNIYIANHAISLLIVLSAPAL